ncbi:2-hydroxychromene-2-carboxylate isomerase [Roseibium aquae]|uniref:2-hydroxychromene-2-carboxylate isomerase n=1 Tax=Roseibium aquae TaxID=1323746 RepID=A0A916TM14_9HYPH|nr:DsbA family protein [Roseibium aquae]GGB57040.1 2-hydroxychromene-2-carboxylate isomerase [Roseibium aquae]
MKYTTEQAGASSSTPSAAKRWAISWLLTRAASERRTKTLREKREAKRLKDDRRHRLEYFHQVDDGYSHLTIQVLDRIKAQYDVDIEVHLVPPLRDDNFPEPELLQDMSRWDAALIAPGYGVTFPDTPAHPPESLRELATRVFCNLSPDRLLGEGADVSDCFWRGDAAALIAIADKRGVASEDAVEAKLKAGAERRKKLKHYGGANFWYEGEWYWGISRLHHLEERLRSLGAARSQNQPLIAPRPAICTQFGPGAKNLTLEYFASLRSPYTAVSWEPTLKLAKDSGVNLVLRPVLPMVMRGVPATVMKGLYFWFDCAREARAQGTRQDKFYDPIGKPVMHGYSIYKWACDHDKGYDFFGAFLKAAFCDGINTNSMLGLKKVVERAGLDWDQAKEHLDDDTWQEEAEENRLSMYGFGSWGVPSYRLLDPSGREILGVWGQDRLWLVAKKIAENS